MGRRPLRRRPRGPRVLLTRLFVAAFPTGEALDDLRGALPSGVRHTAPEKWHVTLAFLGEVDDDRVPEVIRALDDVPPPAPFSLRLTGGGRFGEVIWTGLSGDVVALTALHSSVRQSLTEAGFPLDARPFRPHLTLSYRRFDRRLLTALSGYTGPPWQVTGFSLVSSADGEYTRLTR
ncbi:RNA 2',3'-cyclic phosphodiesterase [Actinoplanes sp. NPDC051851]|uniref:RNA 2',3'-cyclic phosphodiesterase n=1 Tax=Actinoplanes sp. NPDC051851 TaxID=3154753 RepID=UPI00343F99E6